MKRSPPVSSGGDGALSQSSWNSTMATNNRKLKKANHGKRPRNHNARRKKRFI